jgi:hypothetical protein
LRCVELRSAARCRESVQQFLLIDAGAPLSPSPGSVVIWQLVEPLPKSAGLRCVFPGAELLDDVELLDMERPVAAPDAALCEGVPCDLRLPTSGRLVLGTLPVES